MYELFAGCVLGLLATWVFWKYMLRIKPKVEISPHIAVSPVTATGKKRYRFKFINQGSNQVIDISCNAWVCFLQDVPGGSMSHSLYQLPLTQSSTRTLGVNKNVDRPWGLTPEMTISFTPDIDMMKLMADGDRRILLTFRGTDAISGTTVVWQKTYAETDIKAGAFCFGTNMDIVDFSNINKTL